MSDKERGESRIPNVPLFTVEAIDESIGLEAYVCIHAIGPHGSSGGMRCAGDITKQEVQLLAEAMTHKFAFFGIPQGGAKAGLKLAYSASVEERARLIRAAALHLEPLVKRSSIWSMWTDMNFFGADLKYFYGSIGMPFAVSTSGSSTVRTAISGLWSVEAFSQHIGGNRKPTVAIEGYGGVAQHLAGFLTQRGYPLVGLSNHQGAVYRASGLDISEVDRAKAASGADWVMSSGNWERMPSAQIFDVPTEILIPGARVHSITASVASRVAARAVIPIANVPCTPGALDELDGRGLAYLPDYVVNGGGVCGWVRAPEDEFGAEYVKMFVRMLKYADRAMIPVRQAAAEIATASFAGVCGGAYDREGLAPRIGRRIARLPGINGWMGRRTSVEVSRRMARRMAAMYQPNCG